jgi:UDP-N-acetylglucosamine 2-epimerase
MVKFNSSSSEGKYKFILEPNRSMCISYNQSNKLLLFIYVLVSADFFKNRQTIRETWANSSSLAFNYKIIFPIHPRTKKVIEQNNLQHLINIPNLILISPIGYFDTQTLIHYAKFVLTDSGGVTKEAYYHKIQGILLDKQTEWIETINEGWNFQAGPNKSKIIEAVKNLGNPINHSNCLGDGAASEKIVEILLKEL